MDLILLGKKYNLQDDQKDLFKVIADYKKSGVWAFWGETDQGLRCLEVAETKDIFNELLTDLKLIANSGSVKKSVEKYKARKLFDFSIRFPVYVGETRRKAKYRDIAETYDVLRLEIVVDDSFNDPEERKEFECKYAVKNRALYWNAFGHQRKEATRLYEEIRASS